MVIVAVVLLFQMPQEQFAHSQVSTPEVYFFSVVPTSPPDFTPCTNPSLGLPYLLILDTETPPPPPPLLQCDSWAFTSNPFDEEVVYPPGNWSVLLKNNEVDLPSTVTPFQYNIEVDIVNPDFSTTSVTSFCKVVGIGPTEACPISVSFPGLDSILFELPETTESTVIPSGGSLRVTVSAELIPPPVTIGGPAPIRLSIGFPIFVPETDPVFALPGLVTPLGSIEGLIGPPVGGKIFPVDTSNLFLAGLSQSVVWMIPTIAGIAGAGLFVRNPNNIRNVKVILEDYFEQLSRKN